MATEAPKKSTIILVSVLGIIVALLLTTVSIKNNFVTLDETINANWAQVENQMQRRYDLIPNLVNTVKGYAKHEEGVFANIAEARAKLAGAKTQSDKIQAAQGMESAVSRLLVVVENYPNLKANQQFTQLMDELAGSENRLAVERKKYNESINVYNQKVRILPSSIIASLFGFQKKAYFEIDKAAREKPTVQF